MQESFQLAHQVLVNWGQMRPGNYEMGSATLFTGETGSGKSTMLDSLQAVMTGGHRQVLNFNPGQDEVGQGPSRGKTKRSIESYVCGAEYSKYSRPDGAHGYIAGVFVPSKGAAGRPFTALMAVAAHVEGQKEGSRQAVAENTLLFILDGVQLSYSDLMVDPVSGECIPVEQITRHLKQRFPHVLEFGNRKTDYLVTLYGRFRGRPGPVTKDEAFSAAKAWVQSIAYRPIGSVNDLVRNEILEFDADQLSESVGRIASLMRQVADLRKEADYLRASESLLGGMATSLAVVRESHVSSVESQYTALKVTALAESNRNVGLTQRIDQASEAIKQLEVAQQNLEAQKLELDSQRTMVQARMLGIPGQQQKQAYEERIQAAELALAKVLRQAGQGLKSASLLETKAKGVFKQLSELPKAVAGFDAVIKALSGSLAKIQDGEALQLSSEIDSLLIGSMTPEAVRDLTIKLKAWAVDPYLQVFEMLVGHGEVSLLQSLNQQSMVCEQKALEVERTVTDLVNRNKKYASGSVSYPGGVGQALDRIREEFPNAHANVLCDLIDPVSPAWQPAIEAYMGRARFSLLVAPEWEGRVLDFVRANRLDARVIQGSLCLERRRRMDSLPPESIVRELETSSELAEAYLYDQFGLVVKVSDTETLRHTPRGVMKDGKSSGGRTMYDAGTRGALFFGTAARKAQADASAELLVSAENDRTALQRLQAVFTSLRGQLSGLKSPAFELPEVDASLADIVNATGALKALDLSAADGLQAESTRLTNQIKAVEKEITKARDESVRHTMEIEGAQRQIKAMNERSHVLLESVRAAGGRIVTLQEKIAGYNAGLRLSQLDELAGTGNLDADTLHEKSQAASRKALEVLSQVREQLSAYNGHSRLDERMVNALPFHTNDGNFDMGIGDAVALEKQCNERLTTLRSIGLLNTGSQLDQAVRSFNDVFTKQFCLEIRSRVDDGVRILRHINNDLKNLKFGYDRYTLDWARWVPEMREYLEFFEAVTQMTAASEELDLFGATDLEPKHLAVRDKLVALLLDNDQESAQKELMRIADYRNYRVYDIITNSEHGGEIRLSEWGTGSGGQSESPSYAVRAAVMMNRFKCFEKGPSLKMVVSDESFAKMDEARSRAVIHFMRDVLGFQLICAMPTTKTTAILDEFSVRYGFTRLQGVPNGELDFMTEVNCQHLIREEMGKAWDAHRISVQEQARAQFDLENPVVVEVPLDTASETAQA